MYSLLKTFEILKEVNVAANELDVSVVESVLKESV